jgi:H+/Cl- antiporter ClcA
MDATTDPQASIDPADPYALVRTKQYRLVLVFAALVGVPIAFLAYWFLELTTQMQVWFFADIPEGLGFDKAPPWWPVVPLALAGVIVALTISYLPGRGGEAPVEGFAGGGPPPPSAVPGIALAAIASIGLGAVVGPEGPLIALGGGVAYMAVMVAKRDLPQQTAAVIGVTGSFAAISTLLGSPLTGAFLLMEVSGLGGPLAIQVLLPGFLAAGIGALIFTGLDSLTGYGTFALGIPNLPPAPTLTLAQFGWAIAVGVVAPVLCFGIRAGAKSIRPRVERRALLLVPAIGLATAGAAILYAEVTSKPWGDVLFSGETSLPNLVSQSAEYSVGALLLLLACKGIAYTGCIASFRGGPTFPAMFLGAAGGIAIAHLPGLPTIAGVAIGMGAMTTGILRLPLTSVLLTTLFLGADGISVAPLVIVSVVVTFVLMQQLAPRAKAPAEADAAEVSTSPTPTAAMRVEDHEPVSPHN